jgi:hypothetical protein
MFPLLFFTLKSFFCSRLKFCYNCEWILQVISKNAGTFASQLYFELLDLQERVPEIIQQAGIFEKLF